jgi:hypothetical protein
VWEPRKQISYQSAACNTLIATKTARRCFVLGQHVPILDGELHSIAAPTPLLRGILAFLAHACAPPSSKPSCIFSDRSRPGPPSRRRPKRWTDMERSICRRWGRWGVRRGFTGPRRGGGNMLLVYGVVCLEPDRGPEAKGALTATVRN